MWPYGSVLPELLCIHLYLYDCFHTNLGYKNKEKSI